MPNEEKPDVAEVKLVEVTLKKPHTHKGQRFEKQLEDGTFGTIKVKPKQKAWLTERDIV